MEQIRKPIGEKYYFIQLCTSIPCVRESIEKNVAMDKWRFENGNYFNSKEQAQEILDNLNYYNLPKLKNL